MSRCSPPITSFNVLSKKEILKKKKNLKYHSIIFTKKENFKGRENYLFYISKFYFNDNFQVEIRCNTLAISFNDWEFRVEKKN